MGKIIISANVSLDGVVEDPTGDEGFRHGGWWTESGGPDLPHFAKAALDEALGAAALLFGRRSYEWFAGRWMSRSGALADRLTSLPKYIVSTTLRDPEWPNSVVLTGDPVTEVAKLRQEQAGEIVSYASFQLGHTLLEHDLVDELRLTVYPVVLGTGRRLFGQPGDRKGLRLNSIRAIGDGLAFLGYERVAG